MIEWIESCLGEWMNGWVDKDEWMGGWIDGWVGGYIHDPFGNVFCSFS